MTDDYRVPDIVLLDAEHMRHVREEYIAGPPLVVVEIESPGDESWEKLPFYFNLGVPECWMIHRDSKTPALLVRGNAAFERRSPDADGWLRSPATGVEIFHEGPGKLTLRLAGDEATREPLV